MMKLLDKKGQAVVEYIMLIAVVGFLVFAVMKRVMVGLSGTGDCEDPASERSVVCSITEGLSGNGFLQRGSFRYFYLDFQK